MARKIAFLAGGEPALAREPNPAYTEGMIRVTGTIMIDEEEIHQQFIRASGPGGQNVNKVATAVQLRFDVAHSPSLPEDVRERLTRLAGKRMTKEGFLIIDARRFRTQEQNRQDSVARLVGLIRQAAQGPKSAKGRRPLWPPRNGGWRANIAAARSNSCAARNRNKTDSLSFAYMELRSARGKRNLFSSPFSRFLSEGEIPIRDRKGFKLWQHLFAASSPQVPPSGHKAAAVPV